MTAFLIYALAVVGAWWLLSLLLMVARLLYVTYRRRKRTIERFAELVDAIERHPAGSRLPDAQPFKALADCCGSRIYGDSLDDLTENFRYHLTQCPYARRKAS